MSHQVQQMFSAIASKYDFMNDLLSFGIHRRWRKKTVKLAEIQDRMKILDLATGTGDLAFEFAKHGNVEVMGVDFCEPMLEIAKEKAKKYIPLTPFSKGELNFQVGDATALTFQDNLFDISTISFGIRNVDSPLTCLNEMARVVKPGGKVIVLEFGQPLGFLSLIYKIYSKMFMPILGKIFAKNFSAYLYLPETASKFPCREKFIDLMEQTGNLTNCSYYTLSGGIAYIYIGKVIK